MLTENIKEVKEVLPRQDIAPNQNPIRRIRLEYGMSHAVFAKKLGVSVSTLLRLEQGMYHEIPPNILWNLSPFILSPASVCSEYLGYQIRQRASILEQGVNELIPGRYRYLEMNPFVYWRSFNNDWRSRLSLCKDLCLHPSTVKRYEDGLSVSMPDTLKNALESVNVDAERIHNEYSLWRIGDRR